MTTVLELIEKISTKFDAKEFDRFIHSINFPKFKNFAPDAKIDFRFPIAVIVGPNGGGKSSVLHAAWGMPLNHSISRFWFSTPIDPINYDELEQHRVWYSHYVKGADAFAQSRKMSSKTRLNYWEPTRPAQKEGMSPMPEKTRKLAPYMSDTGDRWTPVERAAFYFNAKAETSAVDRFFKDHEKANLDIRQETFIRYSGKLKEIVDNNLSSFDYYGVERVAENFLLSTDQLNSVNKILQKKYKSARYVKHKLYDRQSFSPSVIFETERRNYSECFAGSGELAVVNFVLSLDKLKDFDLLLLDEPETSLHPGAQESLVELLLETVDKKHIQVIISTHSPVFVQLLPAAALVILDETDNGIVPRINPNKISAFARLGHVSKDKITILTEDRLLMAIVLAVLKRLSRDLAKRVVVVASELGASEMLSNQVRAHIQSKSKVLMFLDGDQKEVEDIFRRDPDTISKAEERSLTSKLKQLQVSIIGSRTDFDGWMKWCNSNIFLLDRVCAENVFLELLAPDHKIFNKPKPTNKEFKSALKSYLQYVGEDSSADSQYYLFKSALNSVVKGSSLDLEIDRLAQVIQGQILRLEA